VVASLAYGIDSTLLEEAGILTFSLDTGLVIWTLRVILAAS